LLPLRPYGFEARKVTVIALAAFAALCIKEDQALFLAVTGLFLAWRHRGERRIVLYGLILAGVSILTFVLYFAVLRPRAGGVWTGTHFYDWAHASGDVVPWYSPSRLTYMLEVFLPLLFIPFRSSMMFLAAAPFVELLASPYSILFTNGTHYAGVWIGYVLVAYVYGLTHVASAKRARRIVAASIVICLLQLTLASPTHWRARLSLPGRHDRILSMILAGLPRNATISTYEEAYSHLGFHPNAVEGIRGRPSLIVIDASRPTSYFVPILERYVKEHPAYVKRESEDGISVYALLSRPEILSRK
jgi:hypothetical protein